MSVWPVNKDAFPSLIVSLAIVALIIFTTIIVSGLLVGLFDSPTDPWYLFFTYLLSFGSTLGILMLLRGVERPLYFTKVPAGIYILLIVPTIALVFLREPLIHLTDLVYPMPEELIEQFKPLSHWHPAIFVTLAILAPLLEELIFRGVILDGFLQRYSPRTAIVWSSFIFGIAHMNPWQFISAFLLGLVIGWLYYKTRSLWPGIFLHFLNNAGAYIAATMLGEEEMTTGTEEILSPVAYSMLLFFSLYVCILFLHWIAVLLGRRPVFWKNDE